jgi:anaerobic magnesium-protoporphyrin IX monomethyl ester cyclase
MKISLVNADMQDFSNIIPSSSLGKPEYRPPLGIAYLAAKVKNNHNVSIIDNYLEELSNKKIANLIIKNEPKILGFTTTTMNVINSYEIANLVKTKHPNTIIIFGGIHATIFPEEVLNNCTSCDIVVIGEGENTFEEIVEKINSNEYFNNIPGIYYRSRNKIIKTKPREPIENLDNIPFPARDLLNNKKYDSHGSMIKVKPVFSVMSSRGCPYNCSFCALPKWNRKYRTRSAKNVVDEIEFLIKNYNAKGIYFREDNFTANKNKVIEFCKELKKRNINIQWECESRVDSLDYKTLKMMYDSKCRGIWCGVESGSQRVLNFINKNITIDQIKEFYKNCHKLKIETGALFMIGLPTETKEEAIQSFELAKEIKPGWACFQAYVGLPGCELYDYVKTHKLYTKEWNTILEVETKELSRDEIYHLEIKLNKEYRKWNNKSD